MVKHIVMWTLRKEISQRERDHVLKEMKEKIEALKNRIEQIHSLEVGINMNASDAAFDIVLVSEFHSKEDLEIYQKHPEHLKVVEYLRQIRDKRAVVDYECS